MKHKEERDKRTGVKKRGREKRTEVKAESKMSNCRKKMGKAVAALEPER